MTGSAVRAFVAVVLTQQSRDRSSFFFMLILPLAIIVIIGSTFGGARDLEIAVVGSDGTTAEALANALDAEQDINATRRLDLDDARRDLRRFDIEAALVVMEDGGFGVITNEANGAGFAARAAIQRIVDRTTAGVAAATATTVTVESVGDARFANQGAFALTAAQTLVLFTFITALTAAVILVRARRSGVLRRSLASPASATAITFGVGAGWLALALLQTVIIIAVGALAFNVDWGDPLAAALLVLVFALVGTGSGLLVGSLFSTEDTVAAATPPVGLVLAAIGGCMVPIEVFPDFLLTLSRVTPHYWALEAWKELMFDSANVIDIATQLAVLAAIAAALLVAAAFTLRRSLVS